MSINQNRQTKAGALACIAVFAVSQAHAQSTDDRLWELSVGAKVAHYPEYVGAKSCETLVLPLIERLYDIGRKHNTVF